MATVNSSKFNGRDRRKASGKKEKKVNPLHIRNVKLILIETTGPFVTNGTTPHYEHRIRIKDNAKEHLLKSIHAEFPYKEKETISFNLDEETKNIIGTSIAKSISIKDYTL